MEICKTLLPIFELEISLGNTVESINSPAGTKCPYAVNFTKRFHFKEIEKQLILASSVDKWKNIDSHYPKQSGYVCNKYKHSLAWPL